MDEVLGPNGCLVADKGKKTCLACAPGTVFNALLAELTKAHNHRGATLLSLAPTYR